jgi:hypothetical protein
MASSLFSTLKASSIVFIFDLTNNFCTLGGYELVTASITSSSDNWCCSDVPKTACCKRCEATLLSAHLSYRQRQMWLCRCVWLRFFTPKLFQKFYFKLLITVNMFFSCLKPVLGNSCLIDLDTWDNLEHSTDFNFRYLSSSFKKCTALCSGLLKVGRENSGKIYPPVFGTDTCMGVIEQTLQFNKIPFIPWKQPISTHSITHDQLDAQGSLTALLPDWPGWTWLTSDKVEHLCFTLVLFQNNIGISCRTAINCSSEPFAIERIEAFPMIYTWAVHLIPGLIFLWVNE